MTANQQIVYDLLKEKGGMKVVDIRLHLSQLQGFNVDATVYYMCQKGILTRINGVISIPKKGNDFLLGQFWSHAT